MFDKIQSRNTGNIKLEAQNDDKQTEIHITENYKDDQHVPNYNQYEGKQINHVLIYT
jgi:quinol monooxygenase YgiN